MTGILTVVLTFLASMFMEKAN